MGAVVSRQTGIRTERRISHCFIMDVPTHPDALIITDAAVNIAPTLAHAPRVVRGHGHGGTGARAGAANGILDKTYARRSA